MKIITIPFVLLLTFSVLSQKTITKNDFYSGGDSMAVSSINILDGLSVDYSTTGPNQNWDFSALPANNQSYENAYDIASGGIIINLQFGALAPAKYKANYYQRYDGLPIAEMTNYLPISIEAVNRLVKVEDDKVTYLGYSLEVEGQQIGFRSDTIETAYKLPLNYGDSYTSRGYTKMDFNPFYNGAFIQHRLRSSTVDGFGKLITPFGSYTDIIRIHHNIEEKDSILITITVLGQEVQQWIPINRTLNRYEWWDNGGKRPILRIETESVFGVETVRKITFLNEPTKPSTSGLSNNNLAVSVFPNPTQDFINIQSSEKIEEISILNTAGKCVYKQKTGDNTAKIEVKNLLPGFYIVQVRNKNGQSTTPIIVK